MGGVRTSSFGAGKELSNFTYEFSLLEGLYRLCKTIEDSFLLLLHALEVEFHLPLHLFFCSLLNDYNIAFGLFLMTRNGVFLDVVKDVRYLCSQFFNICIS